jgi:hypothetical protein
MQARSGHGTPEADDETFERGELLGGLVPTATGIVVTSGILYTPR